MTARRLWAFFLLGLVGSILGAITSPAKAAPAEPPPATPTAYMDCRALPANTPPPIWQARLARAADRYRAPAPAQAKALAQRLAFTAFPSPSNMCGPLSLAILRSAGLLPPTTPLDAFWLLNPRHDARIIRRILPPTRFCHTHVAQPLDKFDFQAFPLQPGDLLYLYAGRWDTFEHIFVVSRVDDAGRAYAVTNLNLAPEGVYVVREVLLYDPARPGVGQVYEWTNRAYAATIGVTGHGGFDLWRPLWGKIPTSLPTASGRLPSCLLNRCPGVR